MSGQLEKEKKKMVICTILQRKFSCKCARDSEVYKKVTYQPFCEAVMELYNECI